MFFSAHCELIRGRGCIPSWKAAAPETFFTGAHVDPAYVYELPLLGGNNFPLRALAPNRTFGYISVPENSPAYAWPERMKKLMADQKARELEKKKKKEEEERKGKGKGKDGKKGAPVQLGPHPSSSTGYRGRSRARSQKRNTPEDRAHKVARDCSAFMQLFGVL